MQVSSYHQILSVMMMVVVALAAVAFWLLAAESIAAQRARKRPTAEPGQHTVGR